MQIEITSETERVVREEFGKGHFQSIDDLIIASVHALRQHDVMCMPGNSISASRTLSGLEKARLFGEWAASHPATQPLSEEAMSRESLNPDRW